MCRGHDPLFSGQSALLSLPIYCQCAAHVPPIFNFWKFFAFSALFWPQFEFSRPKFSFLKPSFFPRNPRSLDSTFGNQGGTHPQKKKKKSWVPLPGFILDKVHPVQMHLIHILSSYDNNDYIRSLSSCVTSSFEEDSQKQLEDFQEQRKHVENYKYRGLFHWQRWVYTFSRM